MITIGTTVHLLDLELEYDKKGHLYTKIYRDPKTDEYELPDKFEYHTSQPSNLFKAALNHTIQCCSNEKDFQDERRHLRLSHLMRGFSSSFIDTCVREFYNELDIEVGTTYILYPTISYQTLRQHVLNNYEQRIALKKQEEQNNTTQNIVRIPYPSHWDPQMAAKIKNDLINILKDSSNNEEVFNNTQFELVPRPQTPLTMNDYLVDKRPPLRLLSLPNNEK